MPLIQSIWLHSGRKITFILLILAVMGIIYSCARNSSKSGIDSDEQLPDVVSYNFDIKPLLSDRCFKCHGPDEKQRKCNLRLDIKDQAYARSLLDDSRSSRIIKPGRSQGSEVYHRIFSDDPEYQMPPPDAHLSLSDHEKALIAKWIDQGAKYEPHWSFQKPIKKVLPKVKEGTWTRNEVDHFILEKLEKNQIKPASEAQKHALLRRIALDITGLPPTLTQVDSFLSDVSENAYEDAIDRYLDSPHYGERMALDWLDAARYADTHGYQDDGMRTTWPWRDWVIRSFNENKPYDRFVIEQIAGDMLPEASKDQILATCFSRNHPQTQEGGVVDEEYRSEYVADRTNTFGKVFLGLSVECARCHDHKYDPILQKDYYSLYAFFNNNNDAGIVPYVGEAAPTVMLPNEVEIRRIDSLKSEIHRLEAEMVPEKYVDDLRKWLVKNPDRFDWDYGLVADFDFDKEVIVEKKKLNLSGKSGDWAGIGETGTTTSYINKAKKKPDAAISGDMDRAPLIVSGKYGQGVQMQGDCGIRFNSDLDFERNQPFTVSLWVKLLQEKEKGPIFNKTNGDFEGYRGFICQLNEDGTLSYQLNHVWPDNCIDKKTEAKIQPNVWTNITMTYDGSSRANGLKLYLDGIESESLTLADNLHKSILHGIGNKNWSIFPFMLGREKDRTLENMVMDQLKIFKRPLSAYEITKLIDAKSAPKVNDTFYLSTYLYTGANEKYNRLLDTVTLLRARENEISTNVLEVMVMHEKSQRRPTHVLSRGAYDAPTVAVVPALPLAISSDTSVNDRMKLALWLASKDNPLTARVVVNRIWASLFGQGLVQTSDDFGSQGTLPTHPELLDWLAVDFMENGWDIKKLIKKILLSATYRQASETDKENYDKDPPNEWYGRYPAYRLSAEQIRDLALATCGLLVPKIGGPSVYPYQPKGIWEALATRNATEYKTSTGEDLYRRSMYTIWKRSSPPPSMMTFDAPDRYNCVVKRQKTSTPLQSLILLNDPQYVEAAKVLAEKSMTGSLRNIEERIDFMCRSLIGRPPDSKELEILKSLYSDEHKNLSRDRKKAIELTSVGEYKISKNLDKVDLAAHMLVASTMMNFDEFVMKR